ncbi:hypothetical protein [Neoroseomonas soli]|uniref:Uncharacterized protein n=1 Tax=Neoroseomonas soli TaxID=1081025 RepID=A0A9X9WST2_9PROT|nr:hypothetical protein [Neoroseomonas soli]MBR0670211.1 hypothetical protein [Neoroseomonas soli]
MYLRDVRIGAEFGEAYVAGTISVARSSRFDEPQLVLPPHDTLAVNFDDRGYLDIHPVADPRQLDDGLFSAADLAPRLRIWAITRETLEELPTFTDEPFLSLRQPAGAMWNRFCAEWDSWQPPKVPPPRGPGWLPLDGWGPQEPGPISQLVESLEVSGGTASEGLWLVMSGTLGEVIGNTVGPFEGSLPPTGRLTAKLCIPVAAAMAKGWFGLIRARRWWQVATPPRKWEA